MVVIGAVTVCRALAPVIGSQLSDWTRSPDHGYYHKLAAKHDGHNGKNPTLAMERKILRRCYHTLRELGDAALALPVPEPEEVAA